MIGIEQTSIEPVARKAPVFPWLPLWVAAIRRLLAQQLGQPEVRQMVTLKAPPGQAAVTFFIDMEESGNISLPACARCVYLEGPIPVDIFGVSMSFYRLEYDGTAGYVNARWVEVG